MMIENGEVKLHFLDYWRVIKMRMGLITLVFLLIMVTAGVTTYFLPRKFLATVTMEIKPDVARISLEGRGQTYDPTFLTTQFQVLRTSQILYPVIQKLELQKYYGGGGPPLTVQQSYELLQRSLVLDDIRGTSMEKIGVWDEKPQMAADIANTVATEYRNRRLANLQEGSNTSLSQFEDEVAKQARIVEETSVEAARIRVRDSIQDPNPEESAALMQSDVEANKLEIAVNEQRLKVLQARTQLQEIQQLRPEALKDALPVLGINDPAVATNLVELQKYRVDEVSGLHSGLGERHHFIQAIRARMAKNLEILSEAMDSTRRAQATKVKLEETTLEDMETRLTGARKRSIEDKNKNSSYVEAKMRYLSARRLLDVAQQRLSSERLDKGVDVVPVFIWEPAVRPLGADYPPVKKYMAFAAVIGIVMGVLLAFFIEYLDTSVKTVDDVERFLQTSVLAVIPRGIPMLLKIRGDHADAEAYRILRANLEFAKPSPTAKTLTLISAGPGEGKSTTLNNLAFTCAKGGYNVLVVDADMRRPSQHAFFDTDNGTGLVDFLLGRATLDAITRTTKIDNLSFIPSGLLPADAVGILNSQAMTQLIEQVKKQYDLILFDSPPILGVSDGSVLASEMDMSVMVVQHRRFPRAMLQRVKQAVDQVGGKLVGVVLNNVDVHNDDSYSYFNAYQDYYAAPRGGEPRRPATSGPSSAQPRRPVGAVVPQRHDTEEHSEY